MTDGSVEVWIIFYSAFGHIQTLAEEVKKGLESVEGVEATIYQVAETMSPEELAELQAPAKSDYPIIDPHTLPEADGFVFGFPTYFGMMAAQMKAFFDATGGLWQKGALHGKPASMFTSNAIIGGGQETAILTAVTQLAHHGMIYVPPGYGAGGIMFDMDQVRGGSAWGPSTIAGLDCARRPTEQELAQAAFLGKHLGTVAKKLKA